MSAPEETQPAIPERYTAEQRATYRRVRAEGIGYGFAENLADYTARGQAEAFEIPDPADVARRTGIAPKRQMASPEAEPLTFLPLVWARDATPMLDVGYVVKNIIGCGELIVIYGPPKSGKTFLATDLALCVAAYQVWFGHRVKPGLVLYIAAEMGNRAMRRVHAWIGQRLGEAAEGDIPLAIVPRAVNLLDELEVERLVATLDGLRTKHGAPVLIVIDTLARSMPGGDENSAQDMGRVVAVADRVRDLFNAAVVLVHHSGKDVAKGSRGSSALLGAADGFIRVEADEAGNHTATVEWSRDGESGMRYGFRLPVVELGTDTDGEIVTTCVLEASSALVAPKTKPKRRDVALDALRESIGEYGQIMSGTSTIPKGVKAVTLEQWKARWMLRTGYDAGRSADAPYCRDKADLLKSSMIGISKPFVWIN